MPEFAPYLSKTLAGAGGVATGGGANRPDGFAERGIFDKRATQGAAIGYQALTLARSIYSLTHAFRP